MMLRFAPCRISGAHLYRAVFLSIALVAACPPAQAHGPGEDWLTSATQQAASLSTATLAALPAPVPGAPDMAQALNGFAGQALTPDQLTELNELQVLYQHAARHQGWGEPQVEPLPTTPAQRLLRNRADRQLMHLLEHMPAHTVDLTQPPQPIWQAPPIEVAGDADGVLLRIHAGEGPTQLVARDLDFGTLAEHIFQIPIELQTTGTTWMLLKTRQVPAGETILQLGFHLPGHPDQPWLWGLRFRAPGVGRAQVTILDEQGEPTPCLVRIQERRTRALRRPLNSVDFNEQMDWFAEGPQVRLERPEPLRVPAPWGGFYWVVPGPIDQSFPAGMFDLHVWRGPEVIPVAQAFEVVAGETTSLTVRLSRWTDMAARGWHSGDDHVHSRLMSEIDARRLLTYTRASDIGVSNILRMGNAERVFFDQRAWGPAGRVVETTQGRTRALVPGQEDPRYFFGHAIGLNLTAPVRDPFALNDVIARTIEAQGGLYGFAHVADNLFSIERDMTLLMPQGLGSFGEVLQAGHIGTDLYYDFLDLGYPLAASAGSDVPYAATLGEVRMYAYTGAPQLDVDAWFAAVKRGRTFVSNGPMIELDVNGALPGDSIEATSDTLLRVRARAWGLPGQSAPNELRIVRLSENLQVAISTDTQHGELAAQVELPASQGGWIAVHAIGHDGSHAHSTPVYVNVKGWRPWNRARAAAILDARERTLVDIEQGVALFEQAEAEGRLPGFQIYGHLMVEAAPQIRERVAAARKAYSCLRNLLATEQQRLAAGE